jgi:GH25 family lysozyme M1 (1,4-beta-N-acetylmuramidase)
MTSLITCPIVDLSHHQPPDRCNWTQARGYGIVGAIFKAGQGASEQDPAFADHMWNAYEAGIPLLGGYLFLDDSDPAAQAENLLTVMDDDFSNDLTARLIALDLEGNPMGGSETVAGAAEVASEIFKAIGRWPVIYMGAFGPDGKGTGLPNATLSKCDLWIPKYGAHPRLPKGFLPPGQTPAQHGGVERLWQSTDGTANHGMPVPGLGRVDQSRAVGFSSLEELTAWWGR